MARRDKDTVRLYAADGTFMRRITFEERDEMECRLEIMYEMRPKGPFEIGVKLKDRHFPSLEGDDTSLTERDSKANVGEIRDGEACEYAPAYRINRRGDAKFSGMLPKVIAESQTRIAFWPFEHDRKAVYVPPRVPAQPDHDRGIAISVPKSGSVLDLPGQ